MSALVSAAELARRLGDPRLLVVDCRFSLADPEQGRREYERGHVPGARYAHLDGDLSGPVGDGCRGRHPLPEPGRLAETFGSWGIDASTLVVAYDDSSGSIAARLWFLLRWLGHDDVAVLDGGWAAWLARGGAQSSEVALRAPAIFVPRVRSELVADAREVERARRAGDRRVLDARAPERFRGDVEPIDRVAGHIPGAVSLPFGDNVESGRFRTRAEVRARLGEALGPVPASQAIAYCGSGVTACHLLLAAAHAGLEDMRLYAGSWSEWIEDPTHPIASASR